MTTLKQSLRKKPTYNELVNYIEEDIPIRYPDRTATFLRNSHYLSQFDGDTFIDLEEQENNINKEKLKEMEVRKISAETQTTAQVIRATKKSVSLQTGGIRNTESSSSGTQTDNNRPMTTVGDTQTDLPSSSGVQTERPATNSTSVSTADIFDMTVDDATDAAMADADAEAQDAREREQRRTQNIVSVVSRHLGENVRDLPYLPASSSRDRSRSRARPAEPDMDGGSGGTGVQQTVREDTGGENTKRRGRKPKVAGEGSNPMIVNQEGEQQKRSKSGETASPPARKKQKEEQDMKKIQKAIEKADKAEAKQMIKIEKAVAKADKAAAKAAAKSKARGSKDSSDDDVEISGIKFNRTKSMKFWKEQSPNEIRAQLKLRDLQKFKDEWAFKDKEQLLEIIKDLIKQKKW